MVCEEQTAFFNYIRSPQQNKFNGHFKSRGPTYIEDTIGLTSANLMGVFPQFGNMGREIWMTELCYMIEKEIFISRGLSGDSRVLHLFKTPNYEATRNLTVLSFNAQNPFYNYIISDDVFNGEDIHMNNLDDYYEPKDKLVEYGKNSRISYKKDNTYWVWPEAGKDKLTRAIKYMKYNFKTEETIKAEGLQIGGINKIEIPGYLEMSKNQDISMGPKTDIDKSVQAIEGLISEDKKVKTGFYALYARSEYYDQKKKIYYTPIIQAKKLDNEDQFYGLDIKNFPELDNKELLYKITPSGVLTNNNVYTPTFNGIKNNIHNTISGAANFITNKYPETLKEDSLIPFLLMNKDGTCNVPEDKKTMKDVIDENGFINIGECASILRTNNGFSKINPIIVNVNTTDKTVEYRIKDIPINNEIINKVELLFHENVGQWDAGYKTSGATYYKFNEGNDISLTVTIEAGNEKISEDCGSIGSEKVRTIECNFEEPPTSKKMDITLLFNVREFIPTNEARYGFTLTDNYFPTGWANVHYADVSYSEIYDMPYDPVFWSSFWAIGTLADVLLALSIYSFKQTGLYHGLILSESDLEPTFIAKTASKRSDINLKNNFIAVVTNDSAKFFTKGSILDLNDAIQSVTIEVDSEFAKNEDITMEIIFEATTIDKTNSTTISGSNYFITTNEFPLNRTDLTYVTEFPISSRLDYQFNFFTTTDTVFKTKVTQEGKQNQYLRLDEIINKMELNLLKASANLELIRVQETGFWYSTGKYPTSNGAPYNFFTQSSEQNYEVKWKNSNIVVSNYPKGLKMPINIDNLGNGKGGYWANNLSANIDFYNVSPEIPVPHYREGTIELKGRSYKFDKQ